MDGPWYLGRLFIIKKQHQRGVLCEAAESDDAEMMKKPVTNQALEQIIPQIHVNLS